MRILLDECLDWRLQRELPGHDVVSVGDMGWSGIKNGKLLSLAEVQFQVFITADRNLSFEQNLPNITLAVIVLEAPSIRLADTAPLMPKVLALRRRFQQDSSIVWRKRGVACRLHRIAF